MNQLTIRQALDEWSQSVQGRKVSQKNIKNVWTVFKLYVSPALALRTEDPAHKGFGNSLEQTDWLTLMKACQRYKDEYVALLSTQDSALADQVPRPQENLPAFLLLVFDREFEARVAAGTVSVESKRNYRSPLGQFLKWVISQTSWQELFPENMPEIAPVRPKGLKKPTTRSRMEPYTLKKEELPEKLIQQLEAYYQFRLDGGEKLWQQINRETRKLNRSQPRERGMRRQERRARPKLGKICDSSYGLEEYLFRQFWGWLVKVEGFSLENLELDTLLDLDLLEDYRDWKVEERHTSHANLVSLVAGAIGVAKFLNFAKTEQRCWSDVLIINQLKGLKSEYQEDYNKEHKENCAATWKHQLLKHKELQKLLPYLRHRCAPYASKISKLTGEAVKGEKQSDARIVWFYQAYLLVEHFAYLPNRSQEPLQYIFGTTLFRELDDQNEYRYFAKNIKHKNQRHTGLRNYPLPSILTHDLDEWVQKYKPKVEVALQSVENWLSFWGYKPDELQKLHQRLESARQGNIPRSVKDKQEYITALENDCRNLQKRIDFYPTAKIKFEENNSFFFSLDLHGCFENFGESLSSGSTCYMVKTSIAEASHSVLGKTRWTSPHRFRHIAENKARNPKFSEMVNHSPEMGVEYQEQIPQEPEEHLEIVDGWWKKLSHSL